MSSLQRKPTPEVVAEALALLTNRQFVRRFFEGLNNPEWIAPLRERGIFSNPPPPDRNLEKGTIGFPMWPPSEFLARMAAQAPAEVTETISGIPETENFSVHEDFLEAGAKLPKEMAAKIASKEAEWIKKQPVSFTLLHEKVGRFAVHLAKAGDGGSALKLVQALLSIRFEKRTDDRYRDRVKAKLDSFHYRDFLRKYLPDLLPGIGLPLLNLLAGLLHAFMSESQPERAETGEDYSYIWRPAIEAHEQNLESRIEDALVAGNREAAELLVKSQTAKLEETLAVFGKYKWLLFRRLELNLVRKQGDKEAVNRYVARREFFEELCVQHEYATLLFDRSQDLKPETVEQIAGWLDAGPEDIAQWEKNFEEDKGRKPSSEDKSGFLDRWRRTKLSWFRDRVPASLGKKFADILARIEPPEHSDFASFTSSGWVGKESPKNADELKAMPLKDLVSFLNEWKPEVKGFHVPSRSGLAQTLAEAVKPNPAPFAEKADAFIGLDPTYVRWLLAALEEAIKADRKLMSAGVLTLCEWIVAQPVELKGPRTSDEDPSWSWSRKAVGSFLKMALSKSAVDIADRERVWKILEPITSDPDPTPADEPEEKDESSSGPETISINTTRGEAMHAVMQYALWVRRNFDEGEKAKGDLGFSEMPEVKRVLEAHLDPAADPSPAIRSVFGQWYPWLVLLDKKWATDSAPTIFPTDTEMDRRRTAAWMTYLSFCKPFTNVLAAIRGQYAAAIKRLGEAPELKSRYGDPDERLGEHLMVYFWRGEITLKADDLLYAYMTKADDKTRAAVVEFVGTSLRNTKGEVPAEIATRMMEYWDWLMSGPLAASVGPETAAAFGWWFSSQKLPFNWTLPHLVQATNLAKKIEPQHLVAETLTALAKERPLEAVTVYDLLARNDKEGWNVAHWEKDAKIALRWALDSGDQKAEKLAKNLIGYLGQRGYLGFGELLRGKTGGA